MNVRTKIFPNLAISFFFSFLFCAKIQTSHEKENKLGLQNQAPKETEHGGPFGSKENFISFIPFPTF